MGGGPPRAGLHYPRSTGEFQSWFATDADGRYKCAGGAARTSVTAGTLFDRIAARHFRASERGWMGRAVTRVSAYIFDQQFGVDARGDAILIAEFAQRLAMRAVTGAVSSR